MHRPSTRRWTLMFAAAVLLTVLAPRMSPALQTFKTLVTFNGTNGRDPTAALVQGLDGNLYGTTMAGGSKSDGTFFKMTSTGALTTLYSFCSRNHPYCADGASPTGGVVLGTDGDFYGTTYVGGASSGTGGTVFKVSSTGTLTTLYSFCSETNCADGQYVWAGLVEGDDGNFYGTTAYGGTHTWGTVFEITPAGSLTTLYSFCSQGYPCPDGAVPMTSVVQGDDGEFYGTTDMGGAYDRGTVFRINATGTLTTLYSFCAQKGCPDGSGPTGLIAASDGNFYGTTSSGGAHAVGGTIFSITPAGSLTTVYSFCSQPHCTDGENPGAGLIQATDGNFYGSTNAGGTGDSCFHACGTLFEMTPSGVLTTLISFDGTDGDRPSASLVQATSGTFYGTTYSGIGDVGTVFSLSVGLGPFIQTLPTSGKVGARVRILGTYLAEASSVTFNGVPATFTIASQSEITATVPSGATTGNVQVVTPGGTLTSNVPFQVIQQHQPSKAAYRSARSSDTSD